MTCHARHSFGRILPDGYYGGTGPVRHDPGLGPKPAVRV
jgi:hypothetical protein